jgi:hypothetical protein
MNLKSIMTSTVQTILAVCILVALLVSCGQAKKGPTTLICGSTVDNAAYQAGFGKYFKLYESGKYVQLKTGMTCYAIYVNNHLGEEDLSLPQTFFIFVDDNGGSSVNVDIQYTVGAAVEMPTIVNPNILSGKMSVSKKLSISTQASDTKGRAEAIAATVYGALKEIEGK